MIKERVRKTQKLTEDLPVTQNPLSDNHKVIYTFNLTYNL